MANFKKNKLLKIEREFEPVGGQRDYTINGINNANAIYFYRTAQQLFKPLQPSEYQVITEGGNQILRITSQTVMQEVDRFQICYSFAFDASTYDEDFNINPIILKDKYNELVKDVEELFDYARKNLMLADSEELLGVLPDLKEGEVWVRGTEGFYGYKVSDLVKLSDEGVKKLEDELQKALTDLENSKQQIEDELVNQLKPTIINDVHTIIKNYLTAEFVDIPYIGKPLVQIYIDVANSTVRECDNRKYEPCLAIGLRTTDEKGQIVTRCYFKGVYEKPSTLNLVDGVYWQTNTGLDALTTTQPKLWKSIAFTINNGKIYFNRGNPILLKSGVGTILFVEVETIAQANLLNPKPPYIVALGTNQIGDGGVGFYKLENGAYNFVGVTRAVQAVKDATTQEVGKVTAEGNVQVGKVTAEGDKQIKLIEDTGIGNVLLKSGGTMTGPIRMGRDNPILGGRTVGISFGNNDAINFSSNSSFINFNQWASGTTQVNRFNFGDSRGNTKNGTLYAKDYHFGNKSLVSTIDGINTDITTERNALLGKQSKGTIENGGTHTKGDVWYSRVQKKYYECLVTNADNSVNLQKWEERSIDKNSNDVKLLKEGLRGKFLAEKVVLSKTGNSTFFHDAKYNDWNYVLTDFSFSIGIRGDGNREQSSSMTAKNGNYSYGASFNQYAGVAPPTGRFLHSNGKFTLSYGRAYIKSLSSTIKVLFYKTINI